jgi:ParB-like chromosome segregation protein Spo0J
MNERLESPVEGEQVDGAVTIDAGKPDPIGAAEEILVTVMPIADITVGTRHRKDLGDVDSLARSISEIGLLHPVVVTPAGDLIAGQRRLTACKQNGWTHIPVRVVDLAEIVRGELAENAERKDFLPSEIEAIRRALEPIEKAAAKERMSEGGKGGKVSQPSDGPVRARDKIGALAGVSGRTVEKIAAIVAAAEAEPKKFSHLVEEMDRTGKVDRAHQQLKVERQREANAASGRSSTPSKPKPKGVPGWAEAWSKAPPKQRQKFIEKVGLQAIVAAATDEQKAALSPAVSNVPKEATPAVVPPAGVKSPDEILALVRRLCVQERRSDFLDVFDWCESAAMQMARTPVAQGSNHATPAN